MHIRVQAKHLNDLLDFQCPSPLTLLMAKHRQNIDASGQNQADLLLLCMMLHAHSYKKAAFGRFHYFHRNWDQILPYYSLSTNRLPLPIQHALPHSNTSLHDPCRSADAHAS